MLCFAVSLLFASFELSSEKTIQRYSLIENAHKMMYCHLYYRTNMLADSQLNMLYNAHYQDHGYADDLVVLQKGKFANIFSDK
jgi:hypothetical protein